MVSAYIITRPFRFRAARPAIWVNARSERRNPSPSGLEVLDNLHPFQSVHVRVDVSAAHLPFCQEFLQLFCHPLGEGGDQHALVLLGAQLYFLHQVVYLVLGRTHVYRRIQQTGGTHHLLHYQALALLQLIVARSRADEDPLSEDMLELVEFQGPVVRSGREAETVFDQHLLA